jgi:hypothetical protein
MSYIVCSEKYVYTASVQMLNCKCGVWGQLTYKLRVVTFLIWEAWDQVLGGDPSERRKVAHAAVATGPNCKLFGLPTELHCE